MGWLFPLFKFVVLLAILLALASIEGATQVAWGDWRIEMPSGFLVFAAAGVAVLFHGVMRFFRFFVEAPRLWRMKQKINKMERGQALLTSGLNALAGGDGVEAGKIAVSARKYLGDAAVVKFLQAQAAQSVGDRQSAKELFAELAAQPEAQMMGARGLIVLALREKRWDEAEKALLKLKQTKADTPWLALMQSEITAHRGQWDEALGYLAKAAKAKLLKRDEADKKTAVLLLAAALDGAKARTAKEKLALAERALKVLPGWVPAVLTLARLQAECGYLRAALRLLERNWREAPHQALIDLYRDLMKPEDKALNAYQEVEKFTASHPEDSSARLALAEAALAANLWGTARHALQALADNPGATQKTFRLLAQLERREHGNELAAAQALARMAEAKPDARWICSCGGGTTQWQATCPHCGSVGTLIWAVPGACRGKEIGGGVSLALL